jgi:hypothetical protein
VDSDTDYGQGGEEEEEEKGEEASEYEEGESECEEYENERPVVGRRGLCVLFLSCVVYFFFEFGHDHLSFLFPLLIVLFLF